jgi:outer membrane biosynthesis protein TonB
MTSARKAAVVTVLAVFMAGCRHKAKVAPPPAAQAPAVPLSTVAAGVPPPRLPQPNLPKVNPPGTQTAAPEEKPKPHKPAHHKPKHTVEPEPTPAKDQSTPATEQAATGEGNGMSPIGQLSAAGESTNAPRRHQILDEINSTESGLNDIKRPLSRDEQTTAAQIRTFLAKATDALNQEDLDGAHTLVTKAKVLLDELKK